MKLTSLKIVVVVAGSIALVVAWIRYRGLQCGLVTVPMLIGPAAITALPDGGQKISVASGGYEMVLPHDWHVESTGGLGIAAYPPAPHCKIEVSVFDVQEKIALGDWIVRHLAEDPTLRVVPLSLAPRASGDASGFRWIGMIDDKQTVLGYREGRGKVYEIAPSSRDAAATSSDMCRDDFEAVMRQFEITSR